MELPSLINKVLEKAAPISALESKRINDDCRVWYEGLIKKAIDKQTAGETLTMFDKVMLQMDSWYVRLALTLSYFFIIRFIQQIMNPSDNYQDDEDHEK